MKLTRNLKMQVAFPKLHDVVKDKTRSKTVHSFRSLFNRTEWYNSALSAQRHLVR